MENVERLMRQRRIKRILYLSLIVLFVGIVFFISRGPYISNALKKMILPELENITGLKVIAQKVYLNLFPLFIEARGLKVFDDEGNRILTADRVKGYIGLSGILRRELVIKRIVFRMPEIWTDRDNVNAVVNRVKAYMQKDNKGKIKVDVKVIEASDGAFSFYDAAFNAVVTGKGVTGEVFMTETPRLNARAKEIILNIQDFPEIKCEVNSTLYFKKDGIDIKNILVRINGSEMRASGVYSSDKGASLKTNVALIVDSVKKMFGLRQRGEGNIYAKGDIKFGKLQDFGNIFIDIQWKGNFYIQTLMELLKVNERIEGWVNLDGRINGEISNLTGRADVRLRNGNLFNVDIDDLRCKIFYSNGILDFKDGKGLLYNGYGEAEASLEIPEVEHYSLKVNFKDVDSSGALKLIKIKPEIPEGKVKGQLYTSGDIFNPSGWFEYENKNIGKDFLGRVKNMKGTFQMQNDILNLPDIKVKTENSTLGVNGTVDMSVSKLNLKGDISTVDIADLTSPYLNRMKGSGNLNIAVTGRFDDPLINVTIGIISASFDDYQLENISGEVSYRKNLLEIKGLLVKSEGEYHTIRGDIRFDDAKEILDIKNPQYDLKVSLKGADMEKLVNILYKKMPLKGRVNSEFSIKGMGSTPEYTGSLNINNVEAYRFLLDSVSMDFTYSYKDTSSDALAPEISESQRYRNSELLIRKAILRKNGSALMIEGSILDGKRFSFNASGERLLLKDVIPPFISPLIKGRLKGVDSLTNGELNEVKSSPINGGMEENSSLIKEKYWWGNVVLSITATGTGTFDNPSINLNGRLSGGKFKGRSIGDGTIVATMMNKEILLNALLFDEKMKIKGKAYLNDILPWTAEIDVLSGRYDFLLAAVLKDVPEDLLVNIKGHANLSGDRKHLSASAIINQLNIALFGYSFSNDSDIRLKFEDRKMSFSEFSMKSGNAAFSLRGNIEIGKEYNIVLEGTTALSPLKGFSKRISVLRGDADFTLNVAGRWDNPQISGSLYVIDASFGLKDLHQRVSSINGYFYFEEDSIVVQRLSGKFGGGEIDISGIIYLKGFSIKRFYLDAKLNNISTSISKDFAINFDGNVLYKGTLESQNVTGEVRVNRARYRERVEWKSWLLKARLKEKPKVELTRIEKAKLNIKIQGTENIIVDNNISNATLKADLVLRGTIGHPLLFGRIESKEGKVYFRNNEFRILSASADFADPNKINPVLEIVAQTMVKGYNIKLSLEGQIEHFNLSLTSEPPLEETDILSLLTVGETGRELKGLEGGIGASEAAAFLTGKAQDVFEERMRNITGLDRFQVDPYVSKSTGTVGPRVTVSKKLLGDKLFVTYISSVGSTEEQVLKLEYILGKNVSLVGIRDEKGSVGGDIKFRFEFK